MPEPFKAKVTAKDRGLYWIQPEGMDEQARVTVITIRHGRNGTLLIFHPAIPVGQPRGELQHFSAVIPRDSTSHITWCLPGKLSEEEYKKLTPKEE